VLASEALRRAVARAVSATDAARWRRQGASGWGEAWSLADGARRWYVKLAAGPYADMPQCEADGLAALAGTGTIRVPAVAACGRDAGVAWLALEWLDLRGSGGSAELGRALAQLHRAPAPRGPRGERYGWHRDNWLGGTPQCNRWSDHWCAFFRERRLAPQIALARSHGFGALADAAQRLADALDLLLDGHDPAPSLVHGDLWAGNAARLEGGEPVVFDPAVYVGDREVDLAMAALFGGFDADFEAAYDAAFARPAGHALRRDLYDFYHLLNHVNLFGASYLARSERVLARLLGVVGRIGRNRRPGA
jgi:fructosamine-3-kinase